MFQVLVRITVSVVVAFALAAPLSAQVAPPEGFVRGRAFEFDAAAPFAEQLGGLEFTGNGAVVVYEGGEVRVTGDGETRVIATFRPAVFGSFLRLSPDGDAVYFGESSGQTISRVPLDGSGAVHVDTVALNFDLAFAPASADEEVAGLGFVSGPGASEHGENSVWLLDDDPAVDNDEIVAALSPFSGPIVFDPDGNLYCMTSGLISAQTGAATNLVVRYTSSQLAEALGTGALTLEDGEVLLENHDGWYAMAWLDGRLWGTNLGFGRGAAGIEVLDPFSGEGPALFAATVGASPSVLAVRGGERAFERGSGRHGGALVVAYSAFAPVSAVDRVEPQLWFVRGEVNDDGEVDISDVVSLLGYMFSGEDAPTDTEAADVNDDEIVDIADPIYLLSFLFRGGPEIPAPFPERGPEPEPEL